MLFISYSWYSKSLKGVTSGELTKTLLSILNVYQIKPENLFTQKVMTSLLLVQSPPPPIVNWAMFISMSLIGGWGGGRTSPQSEINTRDHSPSLPLPALLAE